MSEINGLTAAQVKERLAKNTAPRRLLKTLRNLCYPAYYTHIWPGIKDLEERQAGKRRSKEISPSPRWLMAYIFGSIKIWRKIELLRKVLIGLVLMAMISVSAAFGADTRQEDALAAAKNWLTLMDHGEYAKSWQEAAAYFKTVITEAEWVQSLQTVREPLGKVISRKVKSLTPKTSLPNTPEGQYVVIQFETSFEKGKSGVETVTPQLEKDGKWRVAGYHIQWQ